VQRLASELRVSALLAQVLIARGIEGADGAGSFLDSRLSALVDPELLPGLPEAADRVVSAIRSQRRITIYGDYDVDGVTGTALLWHCIRLAGGRVDFYIPSRLEEGYGLNCEALRKLHAEDPSRLVITVDCGIGSLAEAALARELGLELVISDHHEFGPALPEAAGIVHARLPGTSYPFGDLCGVGVAFKIAWGVCQRLGDGKKASPQMREFLLGAMGLAAIGTVADVVPLRGENRVLVKYGLKSLVERATPGLKALMEIAKLGPPDPIHADDVAFGLAPRINAAGRLGQARLAVELLTTDNAERAGALASYLDQLNKSRRAVELRIFKEARELIAGRPEWNEAPALVLASDEWHPGVIGIVASRVAEQFARPAVLIAINGQTCVGQGSGRSYRDVDLHAALSACAVHLDSFGGHAAAAGLRIRPDRIDAFRDEFCNRLGGSANGGPREAELWIDAEVRLCDVTWRAVRELERLSPFGQENPRPVLASTRVELAEPPRTMGEGDRHLSLRVRQHNTTLRAVAFGKADWAEPIAQAGGELAISYAACINRYRGVENVELQLIDWQAASPPAPGRCETQTA
jgi:single-stranded-DNA-specific exonuclease